MDEIILESNDYATPDATNNKNMTSLDSHDAPAGADGDCDAPMVSGAHQPAKEGGNTTSATEHLLGSSAGDAIAFDVTKKVSTDSAARIDRLHQALEARRFSVEPAVFDSVTVIVNILRSFALTDDLEMDAVNFADMTTLLLMRFG